MIYFLGVNDKSESVLQSGSIEFSGKRWNRINIYPFLSGVYSNASAINALKLALSDILAQLVDGDELVTSNEPLNSDVRVAIRRGIDFKASDYERINLLITQYILFFLKCPIKKIEYSPIIDETDLTGDNRCCVFPVISKLEPLLYSRYGIVELRVIENWLTNKKDLEEAERKIGHNLSDDSFMYSDALRQHWLSAEDASYNLRTLMTNAGYYAAENDNASLELWCNEYYGAIKSSAYLFACPGCYPNFFKVQDAIYKDERKIIDYINFPSTEQFYQLLSGHDILFVTPFAKPIEQIYNSGNIYKLYKNIDIPEFSLRTIQAPISTYPNRPDISWTESYNKLMNEIQKAYDEKPFTLFLASAGCYGLPICGFAHKAFGCASLYYGNAMNTLFGIRQQCSEDWLVDQRNFEYWTHSQLGDIKNMERIDNGRYVIK